MGMKNVCRANLEIMNKLEQYGNIFINFFLLSRFGTCWK